MTETDPGSQPAIADASEDEVLEAPADAAPAVTDADESQDPKRKPGAEARISELTRLRRDAERDRDYWRAQATRQTPAPQAAEPEAPKKPPKLSDFEYDEERYQAALVEHVKAETAREVREQFRKEEAQKAEQQRRETFLKKEREFASKHADYMDLTRDDSLPITNTVARLAAASDVGPDLLYYLATNRDEASAIAQMDDLEAARAIGRIESRLEKPAAPAPAPKPVSKAPPPPPQLESGETAVRISTTSPDSDKLSDDEWVKAERKRIARKVKANG